MSLTNIADVKTLDYTPRKNLIIMPCHLTPYGQQHTFLGFEADLYDSNGDLRHYQGYKCAECNPKVETFFENNFIVVYSTMVTSIEKLSINSKEEMKEKYQQLIKVKEIDQKVDEFAQKMDDWLVDMSLANPQISFSNVNPNYGKECKFLEKEDILKHVSWPNVYDSSLYPSDEKKNFLKPLLPAYKLSPKYVEDSSDESDYEDMPELVEKENPKLLFPSYKLSSKYVEDSSDESDYEDMPELVEKEKSKSDDYQFISGACQFYTSAGFCGNNWPYWSEIKQFHAKYSKVLEEFTKKYVTEAESKHNKYYEIYL